MGRTANLGVKIFVAVGMIPTVQEFWSARMMRRSFKLSFLSVCLVVISFPTASRADSPPAFPQPSSYSCADATADPINVSGDDFSASISIDGSNNIEVMLKEVINFTHGGTNTVSTNITGTVSQVEMISDTNQQCRIPQSLVYIVLRGSFHYVEQEYRSAEGRVSFQREYDDASLGVGYVSADDAKKAYSILHCYFDKKACAAPPNHKTNGFSMSDWVDYSDDGLWAYVEVRNDGDKPVRYLSGLVFDCKDVGIGCGSTGSGVVISPHEVYTAAHISAWLCTNPADPADGLGTDAQGQPFDCNQRPRRPTFRYSYNVGKV